MIKHVFGFPTRSDTNRAVQPQKMARSLKFWIWEVEGLHYLCNKNKGTDQLHGCPIGELPLCFSLMQKASFLMMQLIYLLQIINNST